MTILTTKYRYQFSSGGYEGCSWVVLEHEQKFSEVDLSQLMHRVMGDAVLIKANDGRLAIDYVTQIGELWPTTISILKRSYGFTEDKLEAEHHVFAWKSLIDDSFNNDPEANSITTYLTSQGFTKEFFRAWNVPFYEDSSKSLGLSAGIAFRLNEILGRRAITRIEG